MTVFICWYVLCGVMIGFFVNYALFKKFRTWEALCDDFNNVGQDEIKLSPKVATFLVPAICIIMFAIIWAPFLIYVGSKKE